METIFEKRWTDAQIAGLISQSPAILTKHQLGESVDANPEWRAKAQFNKLEVEMLISDPRIPEDRRMLAGSWGSLDFVMARQLGSGGDTTTLQRRCWASSPSPPRTTRVAPRRT